MQSTDCILLICNRFKSIVSFSLPSFPQPDSLRGGGRTPLKGGIWHPCPSPGYALVKIDTYVHIQMFGKRDKDIYRKIDKFISTDFYLSRFKVQIHIHMYDVWLTNMNKTHLKKPHHNLQLLWFKNCVVLFLMDYFVDFKSKLYIARTL